MRASVFIATSLDGYIARADGGLDWLPQQETDESHGYDEFIATVDCLVMGRKTFETVLGFGVWPYGDTPVFVLSTHALAGVPREARVERMAGDPGEIVAQLSARGYQHAYVDGGITIQRFLRAGLVHRLIITRIPVLIGSGIPLFGALERDIRFKHVSTKAFTTGLVQSEYALEFAP